MATAEHASGNPFDVVRRVGQLLREIAATEGQSGKAVQKVRYLNDLAKGLRDNDIALAKLLNPLSALRCLCIPIVNANGAARAAALRALRYLMVTQELHDAVLDIKLDIFIVRSLDQDVTKEAERLQAIKLIRTMMLLQPLNFPLSFGRAVVSIAESTQDSLCQSALSILCELAVLNPRMASMCGGIRAIHIGIVANHNNVMLQRLQKTYGTSIPMAAPLNEFMTLTLLRLYNTPETRRYLRQDIEIETMMAPLLDVHYKHSAESADGTSQQAKNEKLAHINASQMSMLTMFRTWQGLMYMCRPSEKSALQAFIDVLPYPEEGLQMAVMNVIFSIFHLKIPIDTDDFVEALATCNPSEFQEEWQLDQGWVVEEARALLPRRSNGSRVNMMDQYHAVVLQAFLSRGMLERLVEVALSKVAKVSVMATILLGELLHLANTLLPIEMACATHSLPTLVSVATDFRGDEERRNRANSVINNLDYLHQRKKDPLLPNSLYLETMLQQFQQGEIEKRKASRAPDWMPQDTDEAQLAKTIQRSNVLSDKEYDQWDWPTIDSIFRMPNVNIKRMEEQQPKFIRRLVNFYMPRKMFSHLGAVQENRKYSAVGLQFFAFMVAGLVLSDEPPKCLMDLLTEISYNFTYLHHPTRTVFSASSVTTTLTRDYFLFLGKLSTTSYGFQMLERFNIFRAFLEICETDLSDREELQRLLISSLDFSRDGHNRIVLTKLLTNTSEAMRLYATGHLRVLLRAKVPFFHTWCLEMLVAQLCDPSHDVSNEALDVLDEACEDEACLHTLVTLQPSLLHLGQPGRALFSRYVTINSGLKLLKSLNFIDEELGRWFSKENKAYVGIVEYRLAQSMTSFKQQPEGQYTRRSATDRHLAGSRELLVPIHFYGQLAQQREGFELLINTGHIDYYVELVNSESPRTNDQLLEVKAAIWALCHIGVTLWGLKYLTDNGTLARLVELIETSPVCTLRGTCMLALSLIAQSTPGCDALEQYDFRSVRHSSDALWPVTLLHTPSSTLEAGSSSAHTSTSGHHLLVSHTYSDNTVDGSTSESGDEAADTSVSSALLATPNRGIRRSVSSADSRTSVGLNISTASMQLDDGEAFSPEESVDASSGGISVATPTSRLQSLRSFNSTTSAVSDSVHQFNRTRTQPAAMVSGKMALRRKTSNPVTRKGSIPHLTSGTAAFVGVCLPSDINRLFEMEVEPFSGALADVLEDPLGLRFDTFHSVKDCVLCVHHPSNDSDLYESAQIDLDTEMEKGPQPRSSYKSKDTSKEEEEIDVTKFEGRLLVQRDLISCISKLSGAVGSRNNQTQIMSIKDKYKFICKDLCLYSQVAGLLEYYHFRIHVRRFVQHLFDEADFSSIFRSSARPGLSELLMVESGD
ncbi:rapamycin-insensitive companion of mTOR-like [Sycon ciliatum]|uniref:rapamycin-insensitive companion of mTOR-like n=1 Tax=Sycon ciliatum TaxID=27933 RepID=UPI0020ACDA21|eukprot:scpid12489/ scgid18194/ Rapamycin-insensitive companion of mTOR; AVO3 homolog; Protein pianissimo